MDVFRIVKHPRPHEVLSIGKPDILAYEEISISVVLDYVARNHD